MKKLFIALSLLPLFSLAQDCKSYYFMTKNSTIEMTVYDKKGKESGKQTWAITDVKKSGNSYESTVNSSFTDEKGKEISKGTGTYKCDNGILKADIKMSLPQQQMEQYKDMEATMEPVYIEYPSKPSVGQTLADADFTMNTESKSGMKTTITFNERNRKIDSKESVTTSAGTWEAFVISYDSQFKAQLGPIGIPFNVSVKEWFVPNFGIVKTETYSKGGKLIGSTQISAIKK
jgi:hypothetical protein